MYPSDLARISFIEGARWAAAQMHAMRQPDYVGDNSLTEAEINREVEQHIDRLLGSGQLLREPGDLRAANVVGHAILHP